MHRAVRRDATRFYGKTKTAAKAIRCSYGCSDDFRCLPEATSSPPSPAGRTGSRPGVWPGRVPAPCVCADSRAAPPPDALAFVAGGPVACLSSSAADRVVHGRERVVARSPRQAALVRRAPLVASSRPGPSRGSSGAEHVLGKDGVGGSIPLHGTISSKRIPVVPASSFRRTLIKLQAKSIASAAYRRSPDASPTATVWRTIASGRADGDLSIY